MKKALKLSLFIGTVFATLYLTILKFLQPVTSLHLTIFSYMMILSSTVSGVFVFKKYSKSYENKRQGFNKLLVSIETTNGKKIEGILSHISHGFLFLENCISEFQHFNELTFPLKEIRKLEIK